MESKDFNKAIIDYLYGEMDHSEKKEFEQQMGSDPDLIKEINALKSIRRDLNMLEDKEVMEPFSIWGHTRTGRNGSRNKRKSILLRPVTAIAASLVLLMLVGFATNFSLSLNKEGLHIGFQKAEETGSQPSLTEIDVQRMLSEEIQKNNSKLIASMDGNATSSRLAKLEKSIEETKKLNEQIITKDDLNQFFTDMEDRNGLLLQEYLSQASSQQQAYFKTMLTQFSEYLQDQRVEDLNMIQSELLQLNYTQTQQKIATDEVLAGLITKVNKKQN